MKSLLLRISFIFLVFSSFVFGACSLTLNPTTTSVKEGESVRINYETSGCSSSVYYTLRYKTTSGTATSGYDFPAKNWTTLNGNSYKGNAQGYVEIPITLDSVSDDGEQFYVNFELYYYKKEWWQTSGTWTRISNPSSTVTIKDAQAVSIQVDSTSVFEGEIAKIRIYAQGDIPSGESINVRYYTQNDTALSGTNYTNTSGDVTLTSTHKEEYVNVQTINDGVTPSVEPLKYRLYIQTSAGTGYSEQGIKNVDNVSIGFTKDTYTGSEGTTLRFIVRLSGASFNPIDIDYTTSNGSATAGGDYTATTGTLSFPKDISSMEKFIDVPLLSDNEAESNENFTLTLTPKSPSTSSNVIMTRGTATGVIENVDPNEYLVSFTQSTYRGNEGSNLIFTVKINKAPANNVDIHFSTANGTAQSGSDYTAKNGTITFTPTGPLSKTINILLLNDSNSDEYNEDFFVNLTSFSSLVKIPNPKAEGVILGKQFNDADVIDTNTNCSGSYCRSANMKRDFELRFGGPGYAAYGDMTATGESIVCPRSSNGGCNWASTTNVEDEVTTKVNEVPFTKNSSYAKLIIPDEVAKGKHIVFARLYWQGFISEPSATQKTALKTYINNWSHITFRTPDGLKHELNANIQDTNWLALWGKGGRFAYQASVDVTGIVKNYINSDTFQNTRDKNFAAGNIVATTEGDDNHGMIFHTLVPGTGYYTNVRWGHWGGWNLVVVYDVEKPTANIKYKNVAIYDGFTYLIPWYHKPQLPNGTREDIITIDVTGFYTPPSGKIDASMMLFAGSGNGVSHPGRGYFELYNSIDNSWHEVSNTLNPNGQPLNGSYTFKDEPLHENRKNHAATDLDTFDVSNYMSHKQTSAKLRLRSTMSSSGYAYSSLPSLLAFTTEVYSPKVCYEEHIYYNGKEVPYQIIPVVGSMVNTKVEIRNEGFEDAEKIHFYTAFDQNYSYTDDSLLVGATDSSTGIAQTPPIPNSHLAHVYKPNEFGDANISVFVGRDATSVQGGTFRAMKQLSPYIGDSALVEYNMTFYDPNFKEREYHAEYVNDVLKLKYKGQIFECVDTNRSFKAGILGDFNAVSQNPGGTMSDDPLDGANSLYTQISGRGFSAYIVSLKKSGSDKILTPFTGKVTVDLVGSIDYTPCKKADGSYDDACVQRLCNAPITSSSTMLNFNNDTKQMISTAVSNAAQSLMFRMKYIGADKKPKCATSLDNFAVRPETYKVELVNKITNAKETTPFIGGRDYRLEATSTTDNVKILSYNGTHVNLVFDSNFVAGCGLAPTNSNTILAFNDGEVIQPTGAKTVNIGDYKLTITDNTWTTTDQSAKTGGGGDCIVGSHANTPVGGKVGCNVFYEDDFVFIPLEFRSKMYVQNANTINNFTYISNNNGMMATLRPNFEAVLDDLTPANIWDNPIATGYDKACYANDINYDINLANANPTDWVRASTAQTDIHYDTNTDPDTTIATAPNVNPITATTLANAFVGGVANPTIQFNFTRNLGAQDNPFTVIRSDFAIPRIIDVANAKVGQPTHIPQIDTAIPAANEPISFYYGRVWAPDVRGVSPLTNSLRYEVYCDACAVATYPLANGVFNPISNRWRLNALHTNVDGVVNTLTSLSPAGAGLGSTIVRNGPANNIVNGFENAVTLTATGNPTYTDSIRMQGSLWIIEKTPDDMFDSTYMGGSQWSGRGQLGDVADDTDDLERSNSRVNW